MFLKFETFFALNNFQNIFMCQKPQPTLSPPTSVALQQTLYLNPGLPVVNFAPEGSVSLKTAWASVVSVASAVFGRVTWGPANCVLGRILGFWEANLREIKVLVRKIWKKKMNFWQF